MNGGYVMIDLTKYGTIGETPVALNDDDLRKFIDCFSGKPLLLKYKIDSYVSVGFETIETDDITSRLYIPINHYDDNNRYEFEIDVENKTIIFDEVN